MSLGHLVVPKSKEVLKTKPNQTKMKHTIMAVCEKDIGVPMAKARTI